MGVEDNGGPRGEPASGGSSLVVLAACALLLGGGWYWLEGSSDRTETIAAPAPAPVDATPDADGQPAMVGDTAGKPPADSSGSALFGGLGGAEAADPLPGAPPAPVPAPGAAPLLRQALIGSWTRAGESCEAESLMILRDDGSFSLGDEAAGDWSLLENRLTLRPRPGSVRDAKPVALGVEPLGSGRLGVKGPDGAVSTLVRCPDF